MKKYVVKRKDICAGQLVKIGTEKISNKQLENLSIPKLAVYSIERAMLFNVNENGLSNDLIYTTPTNYPIEGIRPKVSVQSQFAIQKYTELEELLKYLKYGVDLTLSDLNQIYKRFIICSKWLDKHMDLFGWQKICDEKTGKTLCYTNGGIETIPHNIYDNLNSISCHKNGKPSSEEYDYSLMKRRK